MRVFLGRVARQHGPLYALVLEVALDQKARSRAALPVDEAQSPRGDVAETSHAGGIAARKNEPLLALDEADQAVAARRQEAQILRGIVTGARGERHVKARGIGAALREVLERDEAADEPDFQRERSTFDGVPQSRKREVVACRHLQPRILCPLAPRRLAGELDRK